jgi:hypothetical protein
MAAVVFGVMAAGLAAVAFLVAATRLAWLAEDAEAEPVVAPAAAAGEAGAGRRVA